MRRKNKSGQSVTPSVNEDDNSAISKSSKKSFLGKLSMRKNKSSKRTVGKNESNTVTSENKAAQKEAEVQKAFLSSNGAQEAKKPYMLKIALLLVDAKTRRFELLQLEFDSDKALVSDALSQIPIHVTEKVLSSQNYVGVCGANGVERKRTSPLFDFCTGNDVLVAIPSGTTSDECARLAKPILSDEKVIGMLSTSGINADPWTNAKLPPPRAASSSKSRYTPQSTAVEKKSGGSTTLIMYGLIGVLVAAAIAFFYLRNSSADSTDDAATEGTTKSSLSVPEFPSVSLDQVWSQCHAACDSSRDFVQKFVRSPPETAADAVSAADEL